jgi:hypothetical protein
MVSMLRIIEEGLRAEDFLSIPEESYFRENALLGPRENFGRSQIVPDFSISSA